MSNGELIDLVAWDPRRPDIWWLRRGHARWLGGAAVERANFEAEQGDAAPIRLHATPMAWLRAECAGACLLRAGREPLRALLWGVRQVVCDDVAHAAVVHKELRRAPRPRLPRVSFEVATGTREAA